MSDFHKIADLIAADDKRVSIAPLSNIVRLQTTKAGLQVTIGIPGQYMGPLARGELSGGLLLIEPAALQEPAPTPTPDPLLAQMAEALRRLGMRDSDGWCFCDPERAPGPHQQWCLPARAALAAYDARGGAR